MDNLTVLAAREAATRARLRLKDERDPRLDLQVYTHALSASDGNMQIAAVVALPVVAKVRSEDERRRLGPWLWSDLVDKFLAVKRKSLSRRYYPSYEHYMRHSAFDEISSRVISTLTIDDLEQVGDRILKTSILSSAKRSVDQMRNALIWAWQHRGRPSGLNNAQYK